MSSDALAEQLRKPLVWAQQKPADPDELLIEALDKALRATTPERPGCPWDELEEDREQEKPGVWFPEGE